MNVAPMATWHSFRNPEGQNNLGDTGVKMWE